MLNDRDRITALDIVMRMIPRARVAVARIRRKDRALADQIGRAISSIALNLAEADGNRDGNRRLRLESAHGSAREAKVALQVALAWGYVTRPELDDVFTALDRASAMTWRRMTPR